MRRFQVCLLPPDAPDGVWNPKAEAVPDADFDTKEEALRFVSVFPGEGRGYIWDRESSRDVPAHTFTWERTLKAN